jgi:GT2 family glycosyltransferase
MTLPLVSVVVPVFNDEVFLKTSLASLAAQTFTDFEVIVSDDASTDRSRSIAQAFAQRDARFQVRSNPVNLGMTRNWNAGLAAAQGRYVVKLDSDDAFRPETLQHLVAAMESELAPMVAYCRTLDCDARLEPFSSYLGEQALIRARMSPLQAHTLAGHAWYQLCFDDIQLWHSNAQMHRRETLQQMGGWDESWGCASDTDLILRVLEQDKRVCHITYAGVLYRHRPGSVSDQYRRQAWLQWESALVHLESLNRYATMGAKPSKALRKAWWRFWQNWQALQAGDAAPLQALREDVRTRLMQRAEHLAPPPVGIRMEGQVRQWVWNLLHRQ